MTISHDNAQPLSVLLITYFFPPAYSGEATYADELARGLLSAGHMVTVLAAGLPGCKQDALPEWVFLVPEPNIDRLVDFEGYRRAYTSNLCSMIEQLSRSYQWSVVHCQEWFGAEASMNVSQKFDIPIAKTVHFVPPKRLISTSPRWQLAHNWQQKACNSADIIIAVSENIAQEAAASYSIDKSKIYTIHNSIDESKLNDLKSLDELSKSYNVDLTGFALIVLSGRLVDQKGIDLLIESIPLIESSISNAKWVICGGNSDGGKSLHNYKKSSKSFGARVVFTGHIPRLDALSWVNEATCIVAPSRFEPFGLSVLEAMFLGKAVIASAVGGHCEMIVNDISGILLPVSAREDGTSEIGISDLATAQIRLLTDKTLNHAMGQAARSRAKNDFSIGLFINRTVNAYRKAALTRRTKDIA